MCAYNYIDGNDIETKDLADTNPALTAKLFERYKQHARAMYAPNMPPGRQQVDDAFGLSAAAAALEAPDACDNDECWERKAHELQQQREAAIAETANGAAVRAHAAQCWKSNTTAVHQLTSAPWYLGTEDIFTFRAIQSGINGEILMQIVQGCGNCAFTKGEGTIKANDIALTSIY